MFGSVMALPGDDAACVLPAVSPQVLNFHTLHPPGSDKVALQTMVFDSFILCFSDAGLTIRSEEINFLKFAFRWKWVTKSKIPG